MKNKFNNNNATFCKITALLSSVMLDKTTLILPAEFKVNFVVVRGGGDVGGLAKHLVFPSRCRYFDSRLPEFIKTGQGDAKCKRALLKYPRTFVSNSLESIKTATNSSYIRVQGLKSRGG